MKHGSLFSGIGGFDLAAEWMGWENVFHCEWNEFGQKVLHHYWPNAESFDDITKTDFTKYANQIDILTGGFPCQPYSQAGKRQGKEDERHLWPQMLRAIREIKPKYIVGENVFGLLNWNGGMVFDEVHSDLEFEGYEVQAVVIPAAAVNAPHGRDRVWFVATNTNIEQRKWEKGGFQSEFVNGSQNATNTNRSTTGSPRTSGSVERNGGNGHLFTEQRGESAELNNRLHEFSRYVTDTNGNGFNQCNGNDEINPGEGRFDAQCNTNTGNVDGDVTNPSGIINEEQSEKNSQRRDRFVGDDGSNRDATNSNSIRTQTRKINTVLGEQNQQRETGRFVDDVIQRDASNTRSIGLQRKGGSTKLEGRRFSFDNTQNNKTTWDNFPTESPICGGDDGLPTELDGITFSKWRNESIKAYGNAIVPQVAYEIFKAIQRTI